VGIAADAATSAVPRSRSSAPSRGRSSAASVVTIAAVGPTRRPRADSVSAGPRDSRASSSRDRAASSRSRARGASRRVRTRRTTSRRGSKVRHRRARARAPTSSRSAPRVSAVSAADAARVVAGAAAVATVASRSLRNRAWTERRLKALRCRRQCRPLVSSSRLAACRPRRATTPRLRRGSVRSISSVFRSASPWIGHPPSRPHCRSCDRPTTSRNGRRRRRATRPARRLETSREKPVPGSAPPGTRALKHLVEEAPCGLFDEVQHPLEPHRSAVVRVRHVLDLE